MTKIRVNPNAHYYGGDLILGQVDVLAHVTKWFHEKVTLPQDAEPVFEWMLQFPDDENRNKWIMHVFVTAHRYGPRADNFKGMEHLGSTNVGLFEADSTGRIENISMRSWRHMDGAELPGFCTPMYTHMLDTEPDTFQVEVAE